MPPLSLDLVDTIWARLVAFYGRRFMLQFEGIEKLDAVKATWGETLANFGRQHFDGERQVLSYPAVEWALLSDNLPTEPPTLPQFREICRTWREPTRARVEHQPKTGMPAAMRVIAEGLSKPLEDDRPEKVRVASRYVAKHGQPGKKLTPTQAGFLQHFRQILTQYEAGRGR